MTKILELRLFREEISGNNDLDLTDHNLSVIYILEGSLSHEGKISSQNSGFLVKNGARLTNYNENEAVFLRWEICSAQSEKPKTNKGFKSEFLRADKLDVTKKEMNLRLDQVTFPPGSRAYRHIHDAAGTRFLLYGNIEINSDTNIEMMTPGDAWFEEKNSPVLAIADKMQKSSFIRCMLMDQKYIGKPTISYLNNEDKDKPKLQTTKRFFDHPISLQN